MRGIETPPASCRPANWPLRSSAQPGAKRQVCEVDTLGGNLNVNDKRHLQRMANSQRTCRI
jgi:hypothetical protein